ncbi:MAG: hypothetical protein JXR68_14290 [Bacteroidales bacterium]|nr:hypothetical protein [Bacteroidales bacterium]
MFDAIKFRVDNLNTNQLQKLVERFALFEVRKHDNKIFWHNQQNSNLKQNFGIYIKIEDGKTHVELSLHKFYNLFRNIDLSNFNDFSFQDTNGALQMLDNVLKVPILKSRLYFFEYGLNLEMTEPPNNYMNDLKSIQQGKNKKEFTWNIYHKKFKLYSTERHSKIRTVYVLYDKTFESKENGFNNVPEKLLRLEIKHKRIEKKIYLADLMDYNFQSELKSKFKKSFIDYCIFEQFPIKQSFSANQLQIFSDFENLGFEGAENKFYNQLQLGSISKKTYKRRIEQLKIFNETSVKPVFVEKKTTIELKEKIWTKLSTL